MYPSQRKTSFGPSAIVTSVLPWLEVQSQATVRKLLMSTFLIPLENGTTTAGTFSSSLHHWNFTHVPG
jgi:hypothetical protein